MHVQVPTKVFNAVAQRRWPCLGTRNHWCALPPQPAGADLPRCRSGRVAAGAVAEEWLRVRFGIEIVAWVSSVGHVQSSLCTSFPMDAAHGQRLATLTREQVDSSAVRCPDPEASERMVKVPRMCCP
jgi:hypothetical protein